MRRIRILGLAVLALFAFGVVTAVAASAAEPGWYECAKNKTEGKLAKGCGGAGTGYEAKPGIGKGKAFKGKGGAAVLHVKTWLGDNKVECAGSKSSGEYALPNVEKNVVVSYSKCKALSVKTCTSPGAKKGEIKTNKLSGVLGDVTESPVNVGLRLESEAEPGGKGLITEFSCENLEGKVYGSVIGELKGNTNTFSKESSLVDVAAERIGEHEFEGKKFSPDVNLVGFANEMEEIEKAEKPPHVLKIIICGEYIEVLLKVKCTPEAYAGLDSTTAIKGEGVEVKA